MSDFEVNGGEMRARFERADREALEAFSRVLTASTSPSGGLGAERDLHWGEFHRYLLDLTEKLQQRHAAKHAAILEPELAPPAPIKVTIGACTCEFVVGRIGVPGDRERRRIVSPDCSIHRPAR